MPPTGRPRKACSTCKSQKIRCSEERPTCKRCLRLGHPCVYSGVSDGEHIVLPADTERPDVASERVSRPKKRIRTEKRPGTDENSTGLVDCDGGNPSPDHLHSEDSQESTLLGIPNSLLINLVNLYFENVYNATLLLHKESFLRSLSEGTARPNVVLSVCAWAANFYRDQDGNASLVSNGVMTDWSRRAERDGLQDAEEFHEDSIVTHTNLCLLWHSQGSWRKSYLHKGIAWQLLNILGLGLRTQTENSLQSEILRRRFWACYLLHCHAVEELSPFRLADRLLKSTLLPWPDADFSTGICDIPDTFLNSAPCNGSLWAETIRGFSIWSSVLSLIRSSEYSLYQRIEAICALDQEVSNAWRSLRSEFKLTTSNVSDIPANLLPRILLLNIVHHQCLCALHASIVPLFCWTSADDDSWSSVRQQSAQRAFQHAGTVSELIRAVQSSHPTLGALPSFIAFALHSGCAIQMPFIWCSDTAVRERAQMNVGANVKMMHSMAIYWKIAALLERHAHCLYNMYKRYPVVLENEPGSVAVAKLTTIAIDVSDARESILDPAGIVRGKGENGLAKRGEEKGLGMDNNNNNTDTAFIFDESQPSGEPPLPQLEDSSTELNPPLEMYSYSTSTTSPSQSQETGLPVAIATQDESYWPSIQPIPDIASVSVSDQDQTQAQTQAQTQVQALNFDVLHPFLDPTLLALLPSGDILEDPEFAEIPWDLDGFNVDIPMSDFVAAGVVAPKEA